MKNCETPHPITMYIGWIHHYFPKLFGGLAFLVNPLFVYLVFTEKTNSFGNYRFLLLYFAIFNVVYSMLEVAVPIGIDGFRYCFFLFLTDGFFVSPSPFHHYILTTRCSMLACSYAILISHFVYRLLVLNRSDFTKHKFPLYMAISFALCAVYFLFFAWICEKWLFVTDETKRYIGENFLEKYGDNVSEYNIMGAIYNEGSQEDVWRSWYGIGMLVIMSSASVSVYIFCGHKIMQKLNSARLIMSASTAALQRKLLKALTVQTVIPICVSFLPSIVAWFSPVFNYNMGRTFNYTGVIALSAFPFFDPVAIIFFLPVLRNRLFRTKRTESLPPSMVSISTR